jgi:hypothetical protein
VLVGAATVEEHERPGGVGGRGPGPMLERHVAQRKPVALGAGGSGLVGSPAGGSVSL